MLQLAAVAFTLSFGASVYGASQPNLGWRGCSPNPLIECGSLQVPLDYADLSAGYAVLAVTRYKAYQKPRLGSMFTNPGGPGGSGTNWIHTTGKLMSDSSNGQYDIVGWDPRGINLTTPSISCGFKTQGELFRFWNGTFLGSGVEARGGFTDQKDIDYFYSQLDVTDAKAAEFGRACSASDGKFLKYMGTVAVVRDLVALSDAIEGEGKKINYWGFSYGTVIGNYFVNMFPDRVGRVIIDGVVDSPEWATQPSYKGWTFSMRSAEATFAGFAQACAQAGPHGCAIAQKGSTAASIMQWVRDLIDTAYHKNGTGFSIRSDMFEALYAPTRWADFAETLSSTAAEYTNTASSTNVNRRASNQYPSVFINGRNEVSEGIYTIVVACLDSVNQDTVTMRDAFDELLRVTHEESPTFGELMSLGAAFICHRFPERAVERFTGPFNQKLSYPILVIGNEADPITPFANAQAASDRLGSSAYLVEQDDFGHSSVAERSDCTTGVIKDYFVNGKLPDKGKFCGTNQVLFPGPPITKGTVATTLSATSEDDGGASDTTKLTKERNMLIAISGSLGVATLLLAVALIFTVVRNRKNQRYAPPSTAIAIKQDMRHSMDSSRPYSDPWDGKKTVY